MEIVFEKQLVVFVNASGERIFQGNNLWCILLERRRRPPERWGLPNLAARIVCMPCDWAWDPDHPWAGRPVSTVSIFLFSGT
jgi:hypothetical protein